MRSKFLILLAVFAMSLTGCKNTQTAYHFGNAWQFYQAGFVKEAQIELHHGVQAFNIEKPLPEDYPRIDTLKGLLAVAEGHDVEAARLFESDFKTYGADTYQLMMVSNLYIKLGQWERAQKLFEKYTVNADTNDFDPSYFIDGLLFYRQGSYQKAVIAFSKMLMQMSKPATVIAEGDWRYPLKKSWVASLYVILGHSYFKLNDYELAFAQYDRARQLVPNAEYEHFANLAALQEKVSKKPESEFLTSLGFEYLKEKNTGLADRYFYQALEKNPKNPHAKIGLGQSAYERGNYEKAIAWLTPLITVSERTVVLPVRLLLHQSYLKIGNPAKAMEHIKVAYDLDPHNPILAVEYRLAANLAQYQKNPKLEQALEIASIYRGKEEFNLAVRYFQRANSHDPKNVAALNGLAEALTNLKEYQQARVYYLQALKLDSKNELANLGLARMYLDAGNYSKVIETADQYLTLAPESKDARLYGLRGKANWLLADNKKASEDFRKALQLARDANTRKYYETIVKTL